MGTQPANERDLWPADLLAHTDSAPAQLLHEQATLVASKTGQALDGAVQHDMMPHRVVTAATTGEGGARTDEFTFPQAVRYSLDLVVPRSEYRYELLWILHDPASDYPAVIGGSAFGEIRYVVNNEEELTRRLREGLATSRTRRVINALVSRSGDADAG